MFRRSGKTSIWERKRSFLPLGAISAAIFRRVLLGSLQPPTHPMLTPAPPRGFWGAGRATPAPCELQTALQLLKIHTTPPSYPKHPLKPASAFDALRPLPLPAEPAAQPPRQRVPPPTPTHKGTSAALTLSWQGNPCLNPTAAPPAPTRDPRGWMLPLTCGAAAPGSGLRGWDPTVAGVARTRQRGPRLLGAVTGRGPRELPPTELPAHPRGPPTLGKSLAAQGHHFISLY